MKQMTYQEAFETLRKAGFAGPAIDRLYRLCQTYGTSELDQAPLDTHRLKFIRWLVATGRLTDQLSETQKPAARPAQDPSIPRAASHARGPFPLFKRKERIQE